MLGMSAKEYNQYKTGIQYLTNNGTRQQLENLYHEIMLIWGRDSEDLKRLDRYYNSKWSIL